MKTTLKNGWEVMPLDGGLPLRKTFFAQTADKTLILATVKGELQLVYESGCNNWEIGSTAMTVDRLEHPLVEPITIKCGPLKNEPE
jgi:hypothetical protein